MLWRWIRRSLIVEGLNSLAGFLGLGNPIGWIVTTALAVGAIAVAQLVAARAWAEGVLEPYGTLGYAVAILVVATLLLCLIGVAAMCYERLWLARAARQTAVRPASDEHDMPAYEKETTLQYNELLAFFIERLYPVSVALMDLKRQIISIGVENDAVRSLAAQSVPNEGFFRSVDVVAGKLGCSPPERVSFRDLSISIHNAELEYKSSTSQAAALASSFGMNFETDERLRPLWEDWRCKHNALVQDYERIRRDPKFGMLFRPMRESRWGKVVSVGT